VKAEKLSAAGMEEKNFVRNKLLHLNHQKWHSAADVKSTSVNRRQAMQTSSIAAKSSDSFLAQYQFKKF